MDDASQSLDVKSELETLTNALVTLTPSRNYLIQLFRLLPADFRSISATYPELFDEPSARDVLVRVFGLQIKDRVELGHGLASKLSAWSKELTDEFGSDDSEKRWKTLANSYHIEVPNALVEWIETKVRMVKSESTLGPVATKVLQSLVGRDSLALKELIAAGGSDERTTRSAVNLLGRMNLVEVATSARGKEEVEMVKLKTGYSAASQAAIVEGIERASKA